MVLSRTLALAFLLLLFLVPCLRGRLVVVRLVVPPFGGLPAALARFRLGFDPNPGWLYMMASL